MQFNEYQEKAVASAIYPAGYQVLYPVLGLVGEAGEVADKVKKVVRDDQSVMSDEKRASILDELGDVLWYVAALARDLQCSLEQIAVRNIEKLESRKNRGVLQGSGDNR